MKRTITAIPFCSKGKDRNYALYRTSAEHYYSLEHVLIFKYKDREEDIQLNVLYRSMGCNTQERH